MNIWCCPTCMVAMHTPLHQYILMFTTPAQYFVFTVFLLSAYQIREQYQFIMPLSETRASQFLIIYIYNVHVTQTIFQSKSFARKCADTTSHLNHDIYHYCVQDQLPLSKCVYYNAACKAHLMVTLSQNHFLPQYHIIVLFFATIHFTYV